MKNIFLDSSNDCLSSHPITVQKKTAFLKKLTPIWLPYVVIGLLPFSPTISNAKTQDEQNQNTTIQAKSNSSRPMTLDMVYRSALEQTSTEMESQNRIEQSKLNVQIAKGRMLPTIDLNGRHIHQDPEAASRLNRSSNQDDVTSAELTISQPLFRGHQLRAGLAIAENFVNMASSERDQLRMSLYADVASLFYEIKLAEAEYVNLKNSSDLTLDRMNELEKRTKIGKSRRGEWLSARSQKAVIDSQLSGVQGQVQKKREELSLIAGVPNDIPLEAPVLNFESTDLAIYLSKIEEHPEIKSLNMQVNSADQEVAIAKGERLPTLDATGNYYLYRTGTLEGQTTWDLSLNISFPLFDGFINANEIQIAKINEQYIKLKLRQRKLAIQRQIEATFKEILTAKKQIYLLQQALRTTEANYKEQLKDYKNSLVTNLEVLQALNTFQETKRTLDRTKLQTELAVFNLKLMTFTIPN